jgi:hypothetical protein
MRGRHFGTRAAVLLAGLVAGFAAATVGGWVVSDRAYPRDFVRLHKFVGGETNFLPTASQLRAIVRARCPRDRTLVLVAGNSIFNGFGQPPEGIWTAHLQDDLGSDYCVVNLATALSEIGDIGAVTVDMLRTEYPRLVLVINTLPAICGPPNGSKAYGYLFWDAYWKGLLSMPDARRRAVDDWAPIGEPLAHKAEEVRLGRWLNAALRFNDLWNYVDYEWLSTVWTIDTRDQFPAPRRVFADPVPAILPLEERFRSGRQPGRADIARFSSGYFDSDGRGGWTERSDPWRAFEKEVADVLPDALRSQTLVVMTELNPVHLALLSAEERKRHEQLFASSLARWQRAGYRAVVVGTDFAPDDYYDYDHFTESGGVKLADALAPRIRELAGEASGEQP